MTYKDFMARLAGLWRVDQSEAFPHELESAGVSRPGAWASMATLMTAAARSDDSPVGAFKSALLSSLSRPPLS